MILNNFNWENYKRQIASDVVDYLMANPDIHIGDLTKLCYELCMIRDFSHLKPLNDGGVGVRSCIATYTQDPSLFV